MKNPIDEEEEAFNREMADIPSDKELREMSDTSLTLLKVSSDKDSARYEIIEKEIKRRDRKEQASINLKNILYGTAIGATLSGLFTLIGATKDEISYTTQESRDLLFDYLPALATLVAAFLGAGTAFLLQNKVRENEKREKRLTAANMTLYILFERLNTIKLFETDFVQPIRNNPAQLIEMRPVLNFQSPKSEFKVEDIAFLFNTKYKALLLDLHEANELYNLTVNAIRERSSIHFEYQSLIEKAGYREKQTLTDQDIKTAVGERLYKMLEQSTKIVVVNVDKFLSRNNELRAKLIKAFSDIFSEEEIFGFELLDNPINKANTTK